MWRHLKSLVSRLFAHLFIQAQIKETSKLCTSLCEGNPLVISGFPPQRVSNAENVSIWWCHHVRFWDNEGNFTTDGLAQDCSNSIANALELLQSCTRPLQNSFYISIPKMLNFVVNLPVFTHSSKTRNTEQALILFWPPQQHFMNGFTEQRIINKTVRNVCIHSKLCTYQGDHSTVRFRCLSNFFSKNWPTTPHSAPMRVMYGMHFVNFKVCRCLAFVLVML